ncbi:MAG: PHP domain-containing protein [Planctomycetota bacterium]
MRRFIDLHTHSNASDGALAPAQVVQRADEEKLAALALTDHDTTAGLAAAQAAAEQLDELSFVPGVEVSARSEVGSMHLLGYGFELGHPALEGLLEQLRVSRQRRNPRMVQRLQELGVDLTMDDVRQVAAERGGGELISRLHIAEAIRRAGHASSTQQAFERYVGKGAAAYVEKDYRPPSEVIDALHAAGGLAVLAHPVHLDYRNRRHLETILRDLMDAGLDGIEVYHSDHPPEHVRIYLSLARRLGLAITGGSDFHGPTKPNVTVGRPRTPLAAVGKRLADRLGLDRS